MVATKHSDAHICIICIRLSMQHLGDEPNGAISCVGCKEHTGWRVQYKNGSQAHWKFVGMDIDQKVIYNVHKTMGQWDHTLFPKKLYCANCGTENPLDLVMLSDYIFKRPEILNAPH